MLLLITIGTYLTSLVIVAALAFVAVIFLAGPHAGLLPRWAEMIVILLAWLTVVILPVLAARKAWRHRPFHDRRQSAPK